MSPPFRTIGAYMSPHKNIDMVEINETGVAISIEHPAPHEFVHALQTGAIEVVQSVLSASSHPELVIGEETMQGCVNILEVVKATLPDPQMMETLHELAHKVMPPPNNTQPVD